jgi:anaerobic ribonucleoside-triphosphate reductase activating protein
MTTIRIANIVPVTRANGPGNRIGIWVQGCTLGCPGCFNPQTHGRQDGREISVSALLDQLDEIYMKNKIDGITISGGEPLQQWNAIHPILLWAVGRRLSVVLFTGFDLEQVRRLSFYRKLETYVDVLIAGRYQQENRVARSLVGSSNKEFAFFTQVYDLDDFENIPQVEVSIDTTGQVFITGINPPSMEGV